MLKIADLDHAVAHRGISVISHSIPEKLGVIFTPQVAEYVINTKKHDMKCHLYADNTQLYNSRQLEDIDVFGRVYHVVSLM